MPPKLQNEGRKVRLDRRAVLSLEVARIHRDFAKPVHSMSFSPDGEVLLAASSDDSLRVISSRTGEQDKLVLLKKYGVDLLQPAGPDGRLALCASRRGMDCAVRLLSVHTNSYLVYFRGHRDRVCSVAASPGSDGFASAAEDATVRFWDVRTPVCQGLLRLADGAPATVPAFTSVAYDPSALVIAVGSADTVRMYDSRQFTAGPFAIFRVPGVDTTAQGTATLHGPPPLGPICFTPDGESLFVPSPQQSALLKLNSFDGSLIAKCTGAVDERLMDRAPFRPAARCVPSCTPDGSMVSVGGEDGSALVWDAMAGGEPVRELAGHVGEVGAVAWNPKWLLAATACTNVNLWIPGAD